MIPVMIPVATPQGTELNRKNPDSISDISGRILSPMDTGALPARQRPAGQHARVRQVATWTAPWWVGRTSPPSPESWSRQVGLDEMFHNTTYRGQQASASGDFLYTLFIPSTPALLHHICTRLRIERLMDYAL